MTMGVFLSQTEYVKRHGTAIGRKTFDAWNGEGVAQKFPQVAKRRRPA